MDADHVDRATDAALRALTPLADADWQVPAGALTWSCSATAAHIAHDLSAYAGQLAARPSGAYLPFDLVVREETPPYTTLTVITACARLLSLAVRASPPTARAWHWGPADPSGFAALGVNELLVHTYDIATGLGMEWRPPADLSAAVLSRLFPGSPPGDPSEVLLWSTGRIALPAHPKRTSWTLKAAVPQ